MADRDLPSDGSASDGLADRSGADALARDYRTPGWVAPRSSPLRAVGVALVVVVVLTVAYYVATVAQVLHTGGSHGSDGGDAIVVMGAAQYDGRPSPQLAARLDHAAALWADGVAPTIVVTGGNQPGDRFTEAEASARYLTDRGVPGTAIIGVGEGTSTLESVVAARPVLENAGFERVVLVTDPFHALRSRLIMEDAGFDVDVASTPTSVVTGWSSFQRSLEEAAGVAVGRLIGFERLSELTG